MLAENMSKYVEVYSEAQGTPWTPGPIWIKPPPPEEQNIQMQEERNNAGSEPRDQSKWAVRLYGS